MSQVEYGPLAHYYELINEHSVPYDDQAALLHRVWARYGAVDRDPRVLDIACGPGLLSRRLLAGGWDVVGIDLSPLLVAQAAQLPGGRFLQADMRALPFTGTFDLACCLLHTVNYMTDDADLAAVFASIAGGLRPGGLLVLDFIDYMSRDDWSASWSETVRGNGVVITCEHDQQADFEAMVAIDHHTYTVRGRDRSFTVSGIDRLRITSATEMVAFAREAGLERLQVTGKYRLDGKPGFDGAVLVARRLG